MSDYYDVLIIGQGLAGSLLAYELTQRQISVLVVDNGLENASQIAAGLINPITGMRLVKSPEIERMLIEARRYYQQLTALFQQPFYIEKPMWRVFQTQQEYGCAVKRLNQADYGHYLGQLHSEADKQWFHHAYGFIEQQQTGYLLTKLLLTALKAFFIARQCYRQSQFDYASVSFNEFVCWQDIRAKWLICCEGYHGRHNPWFGQLPFQLAKGEILTLSGNAVLPDVMLNFGYWFIPLGDESYRLGATFEHQHLDDKPSVNARDELLTALAQRLGEFPGLSVIAQHANVRPTTLDKQPFIGFHPHQPKLAIFNGFGAKGSVTLPFYCKRFADVLLNQASLPSVADISRFYDTHFYR